MSTVTQPARAPGLAAAPDRARYDGVAVSLHWITVILVLTQFALAETWGWFARPTRHEMVMLHMSFGILLGLAVITRLVWRATPGHAPPPAAGTGAMHAAANATHLLLYALILFQFVLGFVLRWSGGESMLFFGAPLAPLIGQVGKPTHHFLGDLHNWTGWTIIVIAAGHAGMGLVHQFVLKDGVLGRMIPALRPR